MHQLVPILAVAALAALQGAFCARAHDTMDNEISINDPVPNNGRRLFVEIKSAPSVARHAAGTTTELTCEAVGHPAPHIQWLKNDMPILEEELENNEIIESSDSSLATVTSTLQIIAVSANKEDLYTCVATSGLNTAVAAAQVFSDLDTVPPMFSSLTALNRNLLSSPRKPKITEYAKTYMGDVNTVLVLPCRATGNPMPEVYWHHNDKHLMENTDSRIKVLESGELMFAPALWADMGSYTCTAKNAVGKESVTTFFYPVINNLSQKSKYSRNRN